MKLKVVVIDLELSPRARRRAWLAATLGLMLSAGSVAWAAWPTPFEASKPLTASDLNLSFQHFETNGRLVGKAPNGKQYSVGFTVFKAATSGSFDGGEVGGYAGAKAACVTATGSESAHMCIAEELVRSVALSIPIGEVGWYATGAGGVLASAGGATVFDCARFTNNSSSNASAFWADLPTSTECDKQHLILCCD